MFHSFLVYGSFGVWFSKGPDNDQSWARTAHHSLYPSSQTRVCFLQDKGFAEAGKLHQLCASSPVWILYTLGAHPTVPQHLAHQRYYLSSLLCNNLWTLAQHKSMQVVSNDVNSTNALFIFRPSLATCHRVLWFAWGSETSLWIFGAYFPFRLLLPLLWQAFPRMAAEWKDCRQIFFRVSLNFVINQWCFFLAWVLSSFSAAVSLIAAS